MPSPTQSDQSPYTPPSLPEIQVPATPAPTQSDQSPYTPPSLPEIQVPATPAPIQQPQPPQPPQGPQLAPGRPGSKAAGIGYMASNIVKGFAQARQQAQIRQAAQMGKTLDGMKFAYQTAKDKLRSLVESGADPNSQEVKEARAGRDSSWAAMMYLYSKYFEQGGQKPKGGSKGKQGQQGEQENPLAMLASPDRHVRAKGWYQLMLKLGPSDEAELRQYQSAPAKQARELQQGETQVQLNKTKKLLELNRLENLPDSPENRQKIDSLRHDPELFPASAKPQTPHVEPEEIPGTSLAGQKAPDGKPLTDVFGAPPDPAMHYRREIIGDTVSYIPSVSHEAATKPGTVQAFIEERAKEAGIPVRELSAQSQLDLQHAFATSKQVGRIQDSFYTYFDDQTGKIKQVPITRSTSAPTATAPNVSRGGETGKPQPAAGTSSSHKTASATSVTSDVDQYGGKTIGEKTPTADKKIMQSVLKNSESARTLSSLLGTQTNYMNEIKADPSKRTPRQDLSLVVAAVRAMNPGSVRLPQKELELEIGAGTWTDQAKRWYDKASTGLLPDDQRNDLFNIVQKETTTVGKNVVADWKQAFPNRPLPSHLKQFDTGDATGGTVNMTDEDILKKIDQLPK